MKKVVIYGAGERGRKVKAKVQECGGTVFRFCKTSAMQNEYFEGIEVISPNKLSEYIQEDISVIIAIENRESVAEVKKILWEKGFLPQQVIDTGDFFDNNLITVVSGSKGGRHCCICGNEVDFMPYGTESELYRKHKVIGGGYREACICPVCNSADRDRWLWHVLKKETTVFEGECNVLHIAPEKFSYRMMHANPKCDYYAGDIMRGVTMHQIDLTNLQFKDDFFDYIIANHVLEHIPNELKAFEEMKRVLNKDGKCILSFPVCLDMDTFEDSKIVSKEDRIKYYGEWNHVRLYGRDYQKRIEQYGFHVKTMIPKEQMSKEDVGRYGLIAEDIIMVCTV